MSVYGPDGRETYVRFSTHVSERCAFILFHVNAFDPHRQRKTRVVYMLSLRPSKQALSMGLSLHSRSHFTLEIPMHPFSELFRNPTLMNGRQKISWIPLLAAV